MSTLFLVISTICFIAAWGIHVIAKSLANSDVSFYCPYMSVPLMCAVPWISGFVLAVIPEAVFIDLSWYWVLLINIPITLLLGFLCANIILRRFATGKGAGWDIIVSIVMGLITLAIGLLLN
jgi:hypothetical protein